MRFLSALALLTSAVRAIPAPSPEHLEARATGSLTSWLSSQKAHSLQGILNNIGSNGVDSQGAKSGLVVASPSTNNPDYVFIWTRDAALTFKALIDQFIAGNTGLEYQIQNYITAQASLQTVNNPSGGLCSGGLGEPKYMVDGTAFTGSWGRPQRDGPALRATALIAYSRYLISKGQTSTVTSVIWPIIQNDLSYVTQYWNQTTFDLWEEVQSSSFFTTAAQYRSLIEGQSLASQLGTSCSNCASQAPLVLCFLQTYWQGSYMLANTGGGRSGRDVNTILSSIQTFDPAASCDSTTFQPCSDKALANHKVVTDSFRSIYNINKNIPAGQGVAVGRYPEDSYYGGNPWYLANFAAAEQLYDAVYQWKRIGSITITQTSLAFFKDVFSSASVGTYSSSTSQFQSIVSAVSTYADSYLALAQKYVPTSLDLAEQFARGDGTPLSAIDLTWSYAALLTASNARAGTVPASWGASGAKLPSSCGTGSANGPCATPTKTTFPTPAKPTTTSPVCSATPTLTSMTFNEIAATNLGQTVYLVGSISQLGSWNTNNAIVLSAAKYSSRNPQWYVKVSLPVGTNFQYKYFKKDQSGQITWESDPNRSYTVPGNCAGEATQTDNWK